MAIGVVLAVRRRSEGIIFIASWFACLLVLSLFAVRLLLYAAPAVSLLAGAGLAALWDWQEQGRFRFARTWGVVLLLILLVAISVGAYSISSTPGTIMSPDRDWQNALAYLREETPEESVVMTHWNFGYWILDLGQRRPVVDNGYYYFDKERNHDIGVAYATNDPAEATAIMTKYGADYLIFSSLDLEFAGAIISEADLGPQFEELSEFPPDSLIRRTLNGDFDAGGGLEVAYRSMPDSDVAILRVTDGA
jgi:dolichyl-diphosphooligosaccharide--protein glycosyltransferase